MANQAPIIPGSYLEEQLKSQSKKGSNQDHFHATHPETNWISCLDHAEKIGIGTKQYELIEV